MYIELSAPQSRCLLRWGAPTASQGGTRSAFCYYNISWPTEGKDQKMQRLTLQTELIFNNYFGQGSRPTWFYFIPFTKYTDALSMYRQIRRFQSLWGKTGGWQPRSCAIKSGFHQTEAQDHGTADEAGEAEVCIGNHIIVSEMSIFASNINVKEPTSQPNGDFSVNLTNIHIKHMKWWKWHLFYSNNFCKQTCISQ